MLSLGQFSVEGATLKLFVLRAHPQACVIVQYGHAESLSALPLHTCIICSASVVIWNKFSPTCTIFVFGGMSEKNLMSHIFLITSEFWFLKMGDYLS